MSIRNFSPADDSLAVAVLKALVCPECRGGLDGATSPCDIGATSPCVKGLPHRIVCGKCRREFGTVEGVPVFFNGSDAPSYTVTAGPAAVEWKSPFKRLVKRLSPRASLTAFVDKTVFDYVNSIAGDELVLNLGSGIGRFDRLITRGNVVNLDIAWRPGVHVVADGHALPFRDGSFACVYSNAVLEHTARPWVVAEEIYRVLKPGGFACINVPFLNIMHERFDYYRFTPQGLKIIFHRFEEIKSGASSGPGSFATYFIPEYISLFVPSRRLSLLIRDILSGLLYPVKYLDYLIKNKERYMLIADSFYFIGRKVD